MTYFGLFGSPKTKEAKKASSSLVGLLEDDDTDPLSWVEDSKLRPPERVQGLS